MLGIGTEMLTPTEIQVEEVADMRMSIHAYRMKVLSIGELD
jgi:hypothetical protein